MVGIAPPEKRHRKAYLPGGIGVYHQPQPASFPGKARQKKFAQQNPRMNRKGLMSGGYDGLVLRQTQLLPGCGP
jgi:hypothetical protein